MSFKFRFFLIIFSIIIFTLCINSAVWFRLKIAEDYKQNKQSKKAIQIYEKVLRKNNSRNNLSDKYFTKINFSLGYLYAAKDLRNLSIESYARGSKELTGIAIDDYYRRNDLDKDKLIAIGLLEAGRWDEAIIEFEKLKKIYPEFKKARKYINS